MHVINHTFECKTDKYKNYDSMFDEIQSIVFFKSLIDINKGNRLYIR